MSLSLSAIDQAKRPDFVPAVRPDEEGERGFSDMLRDSVDRVRDLAAYDRRLSPRVRSEQAIPTAREAREVAQVAARPMRFANQDGKTDAAGKPGLTDVTQAKRKLAAGYDKLDEPLDTPTPPALKVDASGQVQADAEPAEAAFVPADPLADEGSMVVVDGTSTLVTVLLPQPPVLPVALTAGQDGDVLPAENAATIAIADAGAPSLAPAGFQNLIAPIVSASPTTAQGQPLTQPLAAVPDAVAAPNAAAIPVPGFTPVVAPAPALAPVPAASAVPSAGDAVASAAAAVIVTTVAAPVVAPPAAPAASATASPADEGDVDGATGLPAGTTVTVTNQAQVLATKPVRVDGPLVVEQPEDTASETDAPAALPADTAELPAAKPAPLAGAPVVPGMTSGTADDGLSQPLASGAVSTGGAQPDVTAAPQPTAAPAAVVLAGATAEPAQIAIEAEAPVVSTEPAAAATDAHPSSHASATAQAHAADQARFNQADATSRNAMPQHVADQVAVHIAKAIKGGDDHIKISLRPESLGQVEVQLKIAADGRVQAVVQVDKPETMELMQRDARGLERALQDAGLKTDSGSLSFNLRGQDQQREHARNEFSGNGGAGGVDVVAPEDEVSAVEAMVALSRANGGIDVRV